MKLAALLALFPLMSQAQSTFGPSPDPALTPVIQEAEALLPARMRGARPLAIQLAHLDSHPLPEQSRRVARFRNGVIELHAGFPLSVASPEGYRLALRSILHEAAHAWDFSDVHLSRGDKEEMERCRWEEQKSSHCQTVLGREGNISERSWYLHLSGFAGAGEKSKNRLSARSPDSYEFTNSKEHLAIQVEHFLLDPDYACRRPAFFATLKRLLDHDPFPGRSCQTAPHLFTSQGAIQAPLDPARVWEVHFLFASKGQSLMSRWGHAMFRIVQCAPHRPTPGPECIQDVAWHVVLGFRGYVESSMLNYWNGVTGKYPSQLTVHALSEVMEEYNRTELRDLVSLPLRLNPTQREVLVKRLIETYWGYRGSYKFFSNNCASEADQVIRSVLPEQHPYLDTFALSPLGVWNNLADSQLIDLNLLQDRKTAKATGHFFPSQKDSLEQAWTVAGKPGTSLDWILNESRADWRREQWKNLSQEERAAWFLLERAIQRRMKHTLEGSTLAAIEKDEHKEAQAALDLRRKLLPWNLAKNGWGTPLLGEVPESLKDLQDELEKEMRSFEKFTHQYQPELREEISYSRANLKILAQ